MKHPIFIENYIFDAKHLHSIGLKRADLRSKERRAQDKVDKVDYAWPVTIELFLFVANNVQRLYFQSKVGDKDTVRLFLNILQQAQIGYSEDYEQFLLEELEILPAIVPVEEEEDAPDKLEPNNPTLEPG